MEMSFLDSNDILRAGLRPPNDFWPALSDIGAPDVQGLFKWFGSPLVGNILDGKSYSTGSHRLPFRDIVEQPINGPSLK